MATTINLILIGMPEADAVEALKEAGHSIRVTMRDGNLLPWRGEYKPNCINLSIVNGKVASASRG